jgi:hypothetical protein
MVREIGDKDFPIWVLGDSEPPQWRAILSSPLDPRHPIRHNILTSVLDALQDRVYRIDRRRLDASKLFIRNAVTGPGDKPENYEVDWIKPVLLDELRQYRDLISIHRPKLVLSLGAFAFEFGRRSLGEQGVAFKAWGATTMGVEFRARMGAFDPDRTNLAPLLHRSVAGGDFYNSHNYFTGTNGNNYFEETGEQLANITLGPLAGFPIWV